MSDINLSNALREDLLDSIIAYAGNSAVIKIFAGTKPAGGGAETTLLATLTGGTPFGTASNGTLTITQPSSGTGVAANTATWFRVYQSNGSTWVLDGDISTTGAGTGDLQLDNTTIAVDGTVTINAGGTITAPNAP